MTTTGAFARVLIANRGEIALRVIRACRELGIGAVAVYGDREEQARHVRAADDAYRISTSEGLPYLNVAALIAIAVRANVQAIHPGYGFLAENAAFAEACREAGLVFIGPPSDAIRSMGDKVEARSVAAKAGVPAVPGSEGPIGSVEEASAWADCHGYPVAVKAAGGGGGRGFRVARTPDELADAFAGSSGEAARYFANPVVYLERYLDRPRHVEVQIFADDHGNTLALGERDCSVQRRHQKLIEETPSPAVDPPLRAALGEAAVALARAVDYRGAGTVEFLLAEDGRFYFLEMNTRIQVEHTISEAVTGVDLVKEQILVAQGRPLSFSAPDIAPCGHAIECRINAEDAGRDFAPSAGVVTRYREPGGPGVRLDSAMEDGAEILPSYDSLIAKLVVWGRDRAEAIARGRRALDEFEVEGVPTTIPLLRRVLAHPTFIAEGATTAFLAEHPDVLPPAATPPAGQTECDTLPPREMTVEVNGRRLVVRMPGNLIGPTPKSRAAGPPRIERSRNLRAAGGQNGTELLSPIQGAVVRLAVEPGQQVAAGDLVCVVEAMKMENEIVAHRAGSITKLPIAAGESVKIGSILAVIS
ncbi:MAG: acetyl/propionyl/methylcrotonyl-CoA carboxylase subunit alpha [Thermomicrobiales bacterium]